MIWLCFPDSLFQSLAQMTGSLILQNILVFLQKMFKVKKVEQPAGSTTNSAAMMVILNREIADLDYPRDVINLVIDKDDITKMKLTLKPHPESWWAGGKYEFSIDIPPEFNIKPPIVKCLTKVTLFFWISSKILSFFGPEFPGSQFPFQIPFCTDLPSKH